jgi:adenylate cyclase
VAGYSREEAAERAGSTLIEFDGLVALGLLTPGPEERFSDGDARKAMFLTTLLRAGLPEDALAAEFQKGTWSFDFLARPSFAHFSLLAPLTFEELAAETGIPVDLLMTIREAIGSAPPHPTDRVREVEMAIVPHLEAQLAVGYPPDVIARSLRTMGDSLRRLVLAQEQAFATHVVDPVASRPGTTGADISAAAAAGRERTAEHAEHAVLAALREIQAQTWTSRILETFESFLARTGMNGRAERVPAMCFLDISGYTRLTEEQGDQAAADLADHLRTIVQRVAANHGGQPVKWLGDGVMLHFRDPGPGVIAALEMVQALSDAGLPPAHVGLHAGPVLLHDGDHYGRTVNIASRIAAHAKSGEILVSDAVLEAARGLPVVFIALGPVELKGVSGSLDLHLARRA